MTSDARRLAATATMNVLREHYPDMPSLLEAIRRRPGMFLGQATVSGLDLLLAGILFAEDYHDVPKSSRIGGFDVDGFEKWVCSKYNPQQLSLKSSGLARHLAGSETAGFDLWFNWYDEFRAGSRKDSFRD